MSSNLIASAKRLLPPSIQRAITQRLADSHRTRVGGLWEIMGELQFQFLLSQGLEDRHTLLDIGCGSLRGGVKFASYLQPGHYFGLDADAALLKAGVQELRTAGIPPSHVTLRESSSFDMDFGVKFDFALAQSVFTHLPMNAIQHCLLNVATVLAPGGQFFATFFNNYGGKNSTIPVTWKIFNDDTLVTYLDRDPFHYDVSAFRWICEGTDLDVTHIGNWDHPRRQEMLVFKRRAE